MLLERVAGALNIDPDNLISSLHSLFYDLFGQIYLTLEYFHQDFQYLKFSPKQNFRCVLFQLSFCR